MAAHHLEEQTRFDEYNQALDEGEPSTVLRISIVGSVAALLLREVTAEGCSNVKPTFGKQLVCKPRFKWRSLVSLAESFAGYLMTGYDVDFRFTVGELWFRCGRAQVFVESIRQFLVTDGLADRTHHPKHGNVCKGCRP